MASAFDDCTLYHQIKILISFLCKRGIEPQMSYSTIKDFTS